MNRTNIWILLRGLVMTLIQVMVLKRIDLSTAWIWQHGHIFVYPIIVLLFPIRMARQYVILAGFAIGLLMDVFYDTVGVHAFALTGMAYARGILIEWLEPRGGYQQNMSPTHHSMGYNWLLTYTAVLVAIFCLLYFIAEVFTFVYIGQILLKTLMTFILSFVVIMGYHLLFNPRR